jgi:putative metallohydrolase (TIGR04338 family)
MGHMEFERRAMPRDFQASKVQRAESHVNEGERLETVSEMQAWIDKIISSRWWKNRSEIDYIRVMPGRGCRNALATQSIMKGRWVHTIKMPIWSRSQLVILHEICHHLTDPNGNWEMTVAPHGREFCSSLVALVKRWMGNETAKKLREAYRNNRVKTRKRRGQCQSRN